MPWKECWVIGISRKTGYKIFDRYQECGCRGSRTEAASVWLRQPTTKAPPTGYDPPFFYRVSYSCRM
jgi:hypothetical protein